MRNRKNRSKIGKTPKNERFIKLDHWITRSDAWKSLSCQQVRIVLLLLERYNGRNNGQLALSIRQAASDGNMAKGTAQAALKRLVEVGFIKVCYKGSFDQKIMGENGGWYASEYALTFLAIDKALPTREFTNYTPVKKAVSKRRQRGTKIGLLSNDFVI